MSGYGAALEREAVVRQDAALARRLAEAEDLSYARSLDVRERFEERVERSDSAVARSLNVREQFEERVERSDSAVARSIEQQQIDSAFARDLGDAELSWRIAERGFSINAQRPTSFSGPVPGAASISLARATLLRRLEDFGLVEHFIEGDGACQFRALAHQLHGSQARHGDVRSAVVSQLRKDPDRYCGFVQEDFGAFTRRMAQPREWGDHVTLQAAADAFFVQICLVTSYAERGFVSIKPADSPGRAAPNWRRGIATDAKDYGDALGNASCFGFLCRPPRLRRAEKAVPASPFILVHNPSIDLVGDAADVPYV